MCRAPRLMQCAQVWVRLFRAQARRWQGPWEHDSNVCKSCWRVLTSPLSTWLRRLHVSLVPSPLHLFSAQTALGNCLPGSCACRLSPHRNGGPSTGDPDAWSMLSQACLCIKLVCSGPSVIAPALNTGSRAPCPSAPGPWARNPDAPASPWEPDLRFRERHCQ